MRVRLPIRLFLLLLVAAVVALPAQAQRVYTAQQLSAAINKAVFAEALRWRQKLQSNEAQAIDAIERQRGEVARLRRQAASDRAAQQRLSGTIERLESDTEARIAQLLAGISKRDDEISRLLAGFRRSIVQLAESAEGREALQLYNEGRVVESDALIARLDEQELAAQRLGLRLNEAARFRRRAELMLPKIGEGGATTQMVIRLLEQAVDRDAGVSRDWVNLAKLYAAQRQIDKADVALGRARALASNPMETMNVEFATGDVASVKGVTSAAVSAMAAAAKQMNLLVAQNPALETMLRDELAIFRRMTATSECVDGEELKECFLTHVLAAEALMRAYNAKPPAERKIEPIMEPMLTYLAGIYYMTKKDDRAVAALEKVLDRLPALIPNHERHLASLDMLSEVHASLAILHVRGARPDKALASFSNAVSTKRRAVELDPTSVASKLQLARMLTGSGLFGMMMDDKVPALAQLNEARTTLREVMNTTDYIEVERISWYAMLVLALFDQGGDTGRELLERLDRADARGQLTPRDKELLAELRQRVAQKSQGADMFTPEERKTLDYIRGKAGQPTTRPTDAE